MPSQVAKGLLAKKFAGRVAKSVAAHKDDPIVVGSQELPGGIPNGIAQLMEFKVDTYKPGTGQLKADGKSAAGELFVYMAGTVCEPMANEDGVPVYGLRTNMTIPLCDVKNSKEELVTFDENIARVTNELKKFGVEFEGNSDSEIEDVGAMLVEQGPYFRFSTRRGKPTPKYPNPMVFHSWYGTKGLEGYEPPEVGGIKDNTATTASANGKPKGTTKPAPKQEVAEEPDQTGEEDLDALAADTGNEDNDIASTASEALAAIATELGINYEDEKAYPDWESVVVAIREIREGGGDGGDEVDYAALAESAEGGDQEAADQLDTLRQEAGMDDEEYGKLSWTELGEWLIANAGGEEGSSIEAGQVCKYKIKINGKAGKPVDCEIIKVDGDKVSLKNMTTDKIILGPNKKPLMVPTDELLFD